VPLYKEQQYSTTRSRKYVQTTKTKKVTANKLSRFYYILPAEKPAPTIPSSQGFYQPLWDDLDRSNRSLKQTAPQEAKKASETPPPTMKAKASSIRPISQPETTSNHPLLPSPRQSRSKRPTEWFKRLGRWHFQQGVML
jgi:hypothetical protein